MGDAVSTCFPIFACQTRANFKLLRHFNFSPFFASYLFMPRLHQLKRIIYDLYAFCVIL